MTIVATALTAALVVALTWVGALEIESPVGRVAAAAGIIACCGSLGLLVLARLNRRMDVRPTLSELTSVTLVCPACQTKHTLPVGESACPTCRLRIHVRLEEPRCPNCDYLLYRLTSDRCPECGTVVGSADCPAKAAK